MTAKDLSASKVCFSVALRHLQRKRTTVFTMFLMGAGLATWCNSVSGHPPENARTRVRQRVDVIGPIGTDCPPDYRRVYNRPRYWYGKMAYLIAPSSQEAIAWHRADHTGAYEGIKKHQRLEQHYWYPKPWQALKIGARRPLNPKQEIEPTNVQDLVDEFQTEQPGSDELETPSAPSVDQLETLELPETEAEQPKLTAPDGVGATFSPIHVAPTSWLEE